MVRIPITQGTLLEEYIFKGMVKIKKCTRLTDVKEFCNWLKLQLRILVRMI